MASVSTSNITFVSAYYSTYDTRTIEWRIDNFKKIADTGIQICLYISHDLHQLFQSIITEFPNVKLMESIILDETYVYKSCEQYNKNNPDNPYTLPEKRNISKDTEQYIQLQNCKPIFIEDAINKNPWNSTHFAWIDFSVAYIFKNLKKCQRMLHSFTKTSFDDLGFIIPGCWNRIHNNFEYYNNTICWRFCGGFFMADIKSMKSFCSEFQSRFIEYLNLTGKLVWEVNIWNLMENVCDKSIWNPRWYKADHNDSILDLPSDIVFKKIQILSTTSYSYPGIEHFRPSSASYIFFKGEHWLNTRYVSYFLTDQAYYIYSDGTQIIKNKNMIMRLSDKFYPIAKTMKIMEAESVDLPILQSNSFSKGIEDIRLYSSSDNSRIRFIGTSIEYSSTNKGQMIIGDYDPHTATYSNCKRINSPNLRNWEKNWIPIKYTYNLNDSNDSNDLLDELLDDSDDWFIYSWSPMKIGKIIENNGEHYLKILLEHDTSNYPWFNKIRGSTTFTPSTYIDNDGNTIDTLLGLVHFSEEGCPRHYFHCLIELDAATLRPLRSSFPFYFQKIGVEFCIGMAIQKDTYTFWISQMDRDPLMISVDKSTVILDELN